MTAPTPALIAVDVALFQYSAVGEYSVLLIERRNEPYGWALPGGFIEPNESAWNAARRELKEECGILCPPIAQIGAWTQPDRDPRGRVISVLYYGWVHSPLLGEDVVAGDDAKNVRWVPITELAISGFSQGELPLAFDHDTMIKAAWGRSLSLPADWDIDQ